MVFTTCTELYLESEYGEGCIRDAPAKLVYLALHGERKRPEEEVVILSQVLASKATLGYENLCNIRVSLWVLPPAWLFFGGLLGASIFTERPRLYGQRALKPEMRKHGMDTGH